jgi:hypothetical protein
MRNDCESPLLRLPSETSNQIYDYVFTQRPYTSLYGLCYGRCRSWTTIRRLGLALTSSKCRRLHQETVLLPFKLNTFRFEGILASRCFENLLTKEQWAALKHVRLSLG